MAQLAGQRTTSQTITEERLVRQVDDEIGMLEPNVAPLLTALNELKKRRAVKSPRIEWYESDYVARWAQNSSSAVANNAASTTVTVTDGTLFVPGDCFIVPKAVSSSAIPEMCRVTVVAGDVLTVVRNVGAAGIDTIAASAALRLCGPAAEEGAAIAAAKCVAPTKKYTYLQIFPTVLDITGTAEASEVYGASGGDRKREHAIKLKEHKIKINSALLFNVASEGLTAGPNSKPLRTCSGLLSTITTNVLDAGGILTRKYFETFARSSFRYGSDHKLLLASPLLVSAINEWAKSFLQIKSGESNWGLKITEITTGHGVWLMVRDFMLENGISGQNGFAGLSFSLDLENIGYLYLSNNGKNRDTRIMENCVQDGGDRTVDKIETEGGFQIKQEKTHARLYNLTDYQA